MNYDEIDEKLILQSLIKLSELLLNSLDGHQLSSEEYWKFDAQMLSFKLFRHVSSLNLLYQGMSIKISEKSNIEFVDHSSMIVIARAAFETYLVFHHIYGDHSEEKSKYRHLVWRYSGLQDRQKQKSIVAENQQKQAGELKEINSIAEEIKKYPDFSCLTNRQKKQLLSGDWKTGKSWAKLATDAGFHETYFKNTYSYLCGYSHASWASTLQIRDAKSFSSQLALAKSIYFVGIVLMAHFCIAYAEFFPRTKNILQNNEELYRIARIWRFTAEDMRFYDH